MLPKIEQGYNTVGVVGVATKLGHAQRCLIASNTIRKVSKLSFFIEKLVSGNVCYHYKTAQTEKMQKTRDESDYSGWRKCPKYTKKKKKLQKLNLDDFFLRFFSQG